MGTFQYFRPGNGYNFENVGFVHHIDEYTGHKGGGHKRNGGFQTGIEDIGQVTALLHLSGGPGIGQPGADEQKGDDHGNPLEQRRFGQEASCLVPQDGRLGHRQKGHHHQEKQKTVPAPPQAFFLFRGGLVLLQQDRSTTPSPSPTILHTTFSVNKVRVMARNTVAEAMKK